MVAAAAASPAPAPHAAAGRPHPTYTKMITHALTELGGASARAGIAARILGRGYPGLPARHDELLSAHLRRLVAEGVLRLVVSGGDSSYLFAPAGEEEKRGPGRPPRNADATTPAAAPVVVGEKRGRGRPRKSPTQASSLEKPTMSAHTGGIAAPSMLPAKRKLPGEDDPSVTKRGPGRPTTQEAAPIQAGAEAAGGGQEAGAFHNGRAVYMQSGGGVKRGRGRPSKDKPPAPAAAAMSPELSNAASSTTGVKRGRRRPRKEKPPATAAVSRGFKRGCGRPSPSVSAASYRNGVLRKERPPGAKGGRGRPRKDRCVGGLVEGAYEVFFRDMMTEAGTRREEEEDLVSGEKTQTECVAPGDGRAADAGCVPVSGENAASAPVGAIDSDHLGPADLADDVVSTAVKRGRGRPRKEKPAAAMSAETGDAASAGIEPGAGTPRMEESAAARSPETGDVASTGVKRPRGRPRKNPAAAAMSCITGDDAASKTVKRGHGRPRKKKPAAATMPAETGDAASTWMKRGRGRPRKDKPAAAAAATEGAGVKRGRGRPMNAGSVGTWFAESAAERDLFAEEAPGDREEARVADDAGRVPVS